MVLLDRQLIMKRLLTKIEVGCNLLIRDLIKILFKELRSISEREICLKIKWRLFLPKIIIYSNSLAINQLKASYLTI